MILSEVKKYLKSLKTAEGTVDDALIETENSAMLSVTWGNYHKTLRVIDDGDGYFFIEVIDAIISKDEPLNSDGLLDAASFYGIAVDKRTIKGMNYGSVYTRVRPKNKTELANDIMNFVSDCNSYLERYEKWLTMPTVTIDQSQTAETNT